MVADVAIWPVARPTGRGEMETKWKWKRLVMHARNRILTAVAGLALAGGLVAVAAAEPALACTGTCPSSTPGAVSGTVNIAETLTLTLSSTSFTFSPVYGGTTNTPVTGTAGGAQGITATVTTNDTGGYNLNEELNADALGNNAFEGAVTHNDTALNFDAIEPYTYPGGPLTTPAFPAFGTAYGPVVGNDYSTIGHVGVASAMAGDTYQLAWNFQISASTPPDTYTGGFTLLALGN
jgi:hypothetical protein